MGNDRAAPGRSRSRRRKLDYTVALGPAPAATGPRRSPRSPAATGCRRRGPRDRYSCARDGPGAARASPRPRQRTYRAKVERPRRHRALRRQLTPTPSRAGRCSTTRTTSESVITAHAMGSRRSSITAPTSPTTRLDAAARRLEATLQHGLVATTHAARPTSSASTAARRDTLLDFTDPATLRWCGARSSCSSTRAPTASCRTSASRSRTACTSHDGTPAPRCTTATRCSSIARAGGSRTPGQRGTPGADDWFFTRSGYSGAAGQRGVRDWQLPATRRPTGARARGSRSLAPDMLNRAVGGAFGYTTDIGGYIDLLTGAPSGALHALASGRR